MNRLLTRRTSVTLDRLINASPVNLRKASANVFVFSEIDGTTRSTAKGAQLATFDYSSGLDLD